MMLGRLVILSVVLTTLYAFITLAEPQISSEIRVNNFLHVLAPDHNSHHISDPLQPEVNLFTIQVAFDVLGKANENIQACIELLDLSNFRITIPLTCVDHHEFPLVNVHPSKYLFSVQLKERNTNILLPETKVERVFFVHKFENHIPKVSCIFCQNNVIHSTLKINALGEPIPTNVSINYAISDSIIPPSHLQVCMFIDGMIANTCFPHENNRIDLINLSKGSYDVTFFVALASNSSLGYPSSIQVFHLEVRTLEENLPRFSFFDHSVFDFVVPSIDEKVNITIPFKLVGEPSAATQVVTCVQLYNIEVDESRVFQFESNFTCLPPSGPDTVTRTNHISLPNISLGVYELRVFMQTVANSSIMFYTKEEEAVRIQIQVRTPFEFIPTYEWQPLKAWHTIPSGIETRYACMYSQECSCQIYY